MVDVLTSAGQSTAVNVGLYEAFELAPNVQPAASNVTIVAASMPRRTP
jgi:hypothetical protein